MIIGWFSCGITSAVACKMALAMYNNVELYYTDTGSQEEDSFRFLHDCEKWYGKKINVVKNDAFSDHFDVIEKKRFINSAHGAACTKLLKKDMRFEKLGIQKLMLSKEQNGMLGTILSDAGYTEKYIQPAILAENDGLPFDDFLEWFKGYDLSKPMCIIHFTDFRY